MNTQEQIQSDFIIAMKEKDAKGLGILRMIKSSLQNKQIELGHELTEEETVALLRSESKKRRESAEAYLAGQRQDLADTELAEVKFIEKYLPAQMTEEQIKEKVQAVINEMPEEDRNNFGKVMKQVMVELKGQAEGGVVSQVIKDVTSNT